MHALFLQKLRIPFSLAKKDPRVNNGCVATRQVQPTRPGQHKQRIIKPGRDRSAESGRLAFLDLSSSTRDDSVDRNFSMTMPQVTDWLPCKPVRR
jgi:hypothetical protein